MYGYRASTGNVLDTPSALLPGVAASVTSNYWTSNNSGANGVKFFRSLTTVLSVIGLDTGYSTPQNLGWVKG